MMNFCRTLILSIAFNLLNLSWSQSEEKHFYLNSFNQNSLGLIEKRHSVDSSIQDSKSAQFLIGQTEDLQTFKFRGSYNNLQKLDYQFLRNTEDCSWCEHQLISEWNIQNPWPKLLLNYQNLSYSDSSYKDGISAQKWSFGAKWTLNQSRWQHQWDFLFHHYRSKGFFKYLKEPTPSKFSSPTQTSTQFTLVPQTSQTSQKNSIYPESYSLNQLQYFEGLTGRSPLWLEAQNRSIYKHNSEWTSQFILNYSFYSIENSFGKTAQELYTIFKNQNKQKLWMFNTYDSLTHSIRLEYSLNSPKPHFWGFEVKDFSLIYHHQWNQWYGNHLYLDSTQAQNWTTWGDGQRGEYSGFLHLKFWISHFYIGSEFLGTLVAKKHPFNNWNLEELNEETEFFLENDGAFTYSFHNGYRKNIPFDLYLERLTYAQIRPSVGMEWPLRINEHLFEFQSQIFLNGAHLGLKF